MQIMCSCERARVCVREQYSLCNFDIIMYILSLSVNYYYIMKRSLCNHQIFGLIQVADVIDKRSIKYHYP